MNRFVKTLLATGVMTFAAHSFAATAAAPTSTSANVNAAERAKIESVVHDYLLQKPEILMQAFQILQQKQMQEAEQSVKKTQSIANNFATALFHTSNDPVAGNPNGTVTIAEFFDYQCPHCVDMAPTIAGIIKANPNVRVVFKEFPIRGPMSEVAARAALAANKQGKYYDFMHALLTSNQQLTNDVIFTIAKNSGVNVDQLKKDMDSAAIKDQLKANMKLAQDLKLFGTPAVFVGKTNTGSGTNINYYPGQVTQDQLQGLIDKAK